MIEGKVVAITGASSGIGAATARLLAERGGAVVLGARGGDRLSALAREVAGAGGRVASRPTDVARREDVAALVDLALREFGRMDVLVCNAGIAPNAPLADLRVDEWDAMIDVNLRGVLHGVAAALPVFGRQGSGHLVVTGSTAAYRTVPTQVVYAATKTAVRTICEGLRQESDGGYRVTVVSPGFVRTNLADSIVDAASREQVERRMAEIAIPPEAVARAIAYAIDQPDDVDVSEVIVRPTAQS